MIQFKDITIQRGSPGFDSLQELVGKIKEHPDFLSQDFESMKNHQISTREELILRSSEDWLKDGIAVLIYSNYISPQPPRLYQHNAPNEGMIITRVTELTLEQMTGEFLKLGIPVPDQQSYPLRQSKSNQSPFSRRQLVSLRLDEMPQGQASAIIQSEYFILGVNPDSNPEEYINLGINGNVISVDHNIIYEAATLATASLDRLHKGWF